MDMCPDKRGFFIPNIYCTTVVISRTVRTTSLEFCMMLRTQGAIKKIIQTFSRGCFQNSAHKTKLLEHVLKIS